MSKPKLVFVTGAGRGIGREIALRLARDGYRVHGCARSEAQLAETRSLSKNSIDVAAVDVTDQAAIDSWIRGGVAAAGATPWGLVTAAGIHGDIGPLTGADWKAWRAGIEVNLYGTAYACQAFARVLLDKKLPGRIALLSGGGATKPIANMTSYCASKAAVVRFGETLAHELNTHCITVNSIAPGAVNTALTRTIIDSGPARAGQALYDATSKQLAKGGESPEKAAALAAYLMSEPAAPVTGLLISAVWDDWARLHEMGELRNDPDLYRLRRKT